jgi:catalase
VSLTIPVFFVRTPEDFLAFLRARKPDEGSKEPNMERLGAFLGEHAETAEAIQLIVPSLVPPASYATCAFNSLHAFELVNEAGERRWVRYRFVPESGEQLLPEDQFETVSRDYLQEELRGRLEDGLAAFTLVAQLGEEGDPIDDPTVAWPEERETVELGRLELKAIDDDAETDGSIVVFDPINVTDGIELPDDKILHARSKAYSVSADRRAAARQ